MDKISRSHSHQLPDSSSSPLGNIFHNFDEDVMSDFPSCVYGGAQASHHHPGSGISSSGNQLLNLMDNSMKICQNESKLRQHFPHHEELNELPPSFNSLPPSTYTTQTRNPRNSGPGKERKRTMRSAPNG